jgi:formylglycine-generating enzyme required for sulfatase activity
MSQKNRLSLHQAFPIWTLMLLTQSFILTSSGCSEETPTPFDLASRPPLASPGALSKDIALDLGNHVSLKMVLIPAGEFLMGDPQELVSGAPSVPQHKVRITRPFYMGVYEVTQEQYERVMGRNPSYHNGPPRPVEQVTWHDAVQFCRQLSQATGERLRLPTEAEWEYACRAGSTTLLFYGDEDKAHGTLEEYAWYSGNSARQTHPAGLKKPNVFGLYDMYGNVQEWCADWYALYTAKEQSDPCGPPTGQTRILRGGSCCSYPDLCRSALRDYNVPSWRDVDIGFRVVLDPK